MKVPPPQFSSEMLRLALCLDYCLSWEIAGKGLPENWICLREATSQLTALKPEHARLVELYEESPPTVNEERYLTGQIEKLIPSAKARQQLSSWMIACLPSEMEKAAARHPLIRDWLSPSERGLPFRLLRRNKSSVAVEDEICVLESEREEDFSQFLAMPGFEKAFARYWHLAPRNRTNRTTRALVTIGAILSHFFSSQQLQPDGKVHSYLGNVCHFSETTVQELVTIAGSLEIHWYQTADLAYRLLVDARMRDRINIDEMIRTLGDEERTTAEDRKTFHEVIALTSS